MKISFDVDATDAEKKREDIRHARAERQTDRQTDALRPTEVRGHETAS